MTRNVVPPTIVAGQVDRVNTIDHDRWREDGTPVDDRPADRPTRRPSQAYIQWVARCWRRQFLGENHAQE